MTRDAIVVLLLAATVATADGPAPDPFARFTLPDEWQARFWDDPDTKALLGLDPKALAALAPAQAGLRFCRCPNCEAGEASDPLIWSATRPEVVTCMRCGQGFPNDAIPAKAGNAAPEDTIEVRPGLTHHYPYHAVPAGSQRYPDERLYLAAKRDYEAREALARAALYAAVRHHEHPGSGPDEGGRLARFAAVLVLRFAQLYPTYAMHYDQPGQPKFLQPADLGPPFRRGYRTGKWEWTGSLDVPLNLVTAYALVRDDPAWPEVGRLLDDPNPRRTIEHGFFRASAEFSRRQPEEFDEQSLQVYRGLFAVGRLLGDEAMLLDARGRLAQFAERGFYHDGYWRQGSASAHRRVLQQLDGWIERLATGAPEPAGTVLSARGRSSVPMLDLAREASATILADEAEPEVLRASWPVPSPGPRARRPALLGGVGLARLAVGDDRDGLDLEVRGMGNLGSPRYQRQAIRVAVGGRAVLDDLDALPPTRDGWDLATASHNSVVVDGLNQRETPKAAREPAVGGQFLYYAADPDFQVVALDDPLAYPRSTTRYRQVAVAASGASSRYAVTVFQVSGGLQHDQLFHGPSGSGARWSTSLPMAAGPESLLPRGIPYLAGARADDGRWFVQGFGEFRRLTVARSEAPMTATLAEPGRPGVRLHLLGDMPLTAFAGLTPDPTRPKPAAVDAESGEGRGSLIVRRRSADGGTLASTFVTLFEPIGAAPPLKRVGRVGAAEGVVVLYVETADGPESLVVNLTPGTPRTVAFPDGRTASTDGLVLRIGPTGLQLAGGTFARYDGIELRQGRLAGPVLAVGRAEGAETRGWFAVGGSIEEFAGVEGRTLLIRHGDGTVRGWTIHDAEPDGRRRVKLHVREEPGFLLDLDTSEARYYQFPRLVSPGPHEYSVSRLGRSGASVK